MNAYSFFRRGFAARLAETFLEADSGERQQDDIWEKAVLMADHSQNHLR